MHHLQIAHTLDAERADRADPLPGVPTAIILCSDKRLTSSQPAVQI
jgi:hypothetical protein